MNNIDEAAMLIDEWTKNGYELNSAVGDTYAIPRILADAGLLAPDLPEPHGVDGISPCWCVLSQHEDMQVDALPSGKVRLWDAPDFKTPIASTEARDLALALLAAANHAEQEGKK